MSIDNLDHLKDKSLDMRMHGRELRPRPKLRVALKGNAWARNLRLSAGEVLQVGRASPMEEN